MRLKTLLPQDSRGNSNTGTIAGSGTSLVSGYIGTALSFNGSGYVTFTSISPFTLASASSEISVCCWIKLTAADGNILSIRNSGNGSPVLDFGVGYNGVDNASTGKLSILSRDNAGLGLTGCTSAGTVNNGNWHHVAFTRSSAQLITIYIDGAVNGTPVTDGGTAGITPNVAGCAIAKEMLNAGIPTFNGLIDDFQVYNRALTSTEIGAIYSYIPTAWVAEALLAAAGALGANVRAIQSARSTLPASGKVTADAFIKGRIPAEAALKPEGSLLALARALNSGNARLSTAGGLRVAANILTPPSPPYVGVIAHKGTDIMEMVTTNLNADMEMLLSSGTLAGRSSPERGPAEVITVSAPLYLLDRTLGADWTDVEQLMTRVGQLEARVAELEQLIIDPDSFLNVGFYANAAALPTPPDAPPEVTVLAYNNGAGKLKVWDPSSGTWKNA